MKNYQNENFNTKYKKLLNDLLNISRNDSCIFSNINNKTVFDVKQKFGDEFFDQIFLSETFYLPLDQSNIDKLIEQVQRCQSLEELNRIPKNSFLDEIQEKLNKKSISNLDKLKEEIINSINVSKQKSAFDWKIILNKARSLNEQNNLWPIHLGFIYITLKIDNKVIQAPMFFKEVNIKIKNSKVSLVSIGDIKINEKLTYFLEANNFLLNIDIDYSKMSIKSLFDVISRSWSQNLRVPDSLKGFVPNFKESEINNNTISIWPGISLGFFEPTGGYLRKMMLKILNNNELDDVLDIEFDKNIYKKTIKDSIFKKNFGFYKIVHSNLSQDKATVSALNQNTIIWGPPGTGKSQTITNILTNILMFNKTALVVSQKKAALEVLKERMKSLEAFCLFILNDKEMNKKSFYEPIKRYINYLENFDEKSEEKMIKIISDKEKLLMKLTNAIMKNELANENIKLFSDFIETNKYEIEIIEKLMNLDPQYNYNINEMKHIKPKINKIAKFIMKQNEIKKRNIFFPINKNIKIQANNIIENFLHRNINVDYFLDNKEKINTSIWSELNELHSLKLNMEKETSHLINDDNNLRILIFEMIFKKIKNFDSEMKSKYSNFALDARAASLDPIVFIKKHIDIIKKIYPIIITTPETDLQGWSKQEFDYALLDESSQIFLEKGLPILYLAKIKILAGDDQQMQPSKWFASKTFDDENPFNGIESLLDYAIAKGTYSLLLDKNYRSSFASLMTFNSQIFYKGELDVINTWKEENGFQPIEVINVNGVWENSQNVEEVEEVVRQAIANLDRYKKIILLAFNASQQSAIEVKIFEEYPELERAIEEQRILIRNIENIQGDEADLLIASIAYDKNTKLHATYVAKPGGKNALNVATSRARDKMIIIKSIYANDIQNNSNLDDIEVFKLWLEFLDLSEEEKKNYKYYKNQNLNETKENERIINQTNTELVLNDLSSELIAKIKNDLNQNVIAFEDKFDFVINYSIGTIKMPIAIIDKMKNQFLIGLYVDVYNYWKSYEEYVLDKDVEDFFLIKKYPVKRISFLNWNKEKQAIFEKLNSHI